MLLVQICHCLCEAEVSHKVCGYENVQYMHKNMPSVAADSYIS